MAGTRYKESRTLVRGLRRLYDERREDFKCKVLRLRRQFEKFNINASEICQWLMAIRPGGKKGCDATKDFWEFFLEPERFLDDEDKDESERYRRIVFDIAAGLETESNVADVGLSQPVVDSVRKVAKLSPTPTARKLFERLLVLDASHRQVLLKAAAEWIVARYLRGYQNWERQHEEWAKEKAEWEKEHPKLAVSVREEFNDIFKGLKIRSKKYRVCKWEQLKAGKDNCEYAGESIGKKRHGMLCVKYKKFLDSYGRESGAGKNFNKKYFVENAKDYINLRRASRGTNDVAMERFLRQHPNARWFPQAWEAYLKALEINEQTVLEGGGELLHCVKFGADQECQYNKHTNECQEYRKCLEKRPDLQEFEVVYREWRGEYLSGPSKTSFRYPSQRRLPMPKIFGSGYFRVDFVKSVLELRLDDKGEGEFERFGFASWPRDYQPQPQETEITSVHINFVGTRARVGFHFKVQHKKSRFGVSQDEIDEIRSRKYPRGAQDQQFLNEARKRLLESFGGDVERDLKILAVDLGTLGGGVSVFEGRYFKKSEPLKIIKIDRIYDKLPMQDKNEKQRRSQEEWKKLKEKGLSKEHVGRHLESWAGGEKEIAERRGKSGIGEYDMRRLSIHVRWMIRDWVRLNTSQIIETAERNKIDLIVFESMRGFRAPGYDKLDEDKKRRLAFFAHGRIRHKVREKAVERGMLVVTVPYLKSSQFCAKCGKERQDRKTWEKNKRAHRFSCEKCGHKDNSDENAAGVLGRVFWGEIDLPKKLTAHT